MAKIYLKRVKSEIHETGRGMNCSSAHGKRCFFDNGFSCNLQDKFCLDDKFDCGPPDHGFVFIRVDER